MGIRLQRHLGAPTQLDPGQYTLATGQVILSCPLCDSVASLPMSHVVDRAGAVTPRYMCMRCPFEDFITLESYGEDIGA